MAKITFNRIVSNFSFKAAFNSFLELLEQELQDKVLYRNNPSGEANTMFNDLDMSGNDILNARNVSATGLIVDGKDVYQVLADSTSSQADVITAAQAAAQARDDADAVMATISATNGVFTDPYKTKLDGISTGAQRNDEITKANVEAVLTGNITTHSHGDKANAIINGAMHIDQRNGGTAQTIVAGSALAYCLDRWYAYCTGANVTTQMVPTGQWNGYRLKVTGAASNTGVGIGQRIEYLNADFLVGKTAALSLKAKSSSLTSLGWALYYASTYNSFGTLASPTRTLISSGSFTINSTDTTYSTNISIPAAATTGLELVLTGGPLLASQTLEIGEVKLERDIATTWVSPSFDDDLRRCQRYYEKSFRHGTVPVQGIGTYEGTAQAVMAGRVGAIQNFINTKYSVTKRGDATVTIYNPINVNAQVSDLSIGGDCSSTSVLVTGDGGFWVTTVGHASTTVGSLLIFHWTAQAEL